MSRLRLAPVAAATISLALALTACGGDTTSAGASGSSGGEGATITYGIYEPGADSGYLLMGKEKDFFAKHGVKVNVVQMKSGQQAFPALLAKQVDIIQGNPSEALLAVQKGAKLKFVGSTMPGQNYALYARNDITSLTDISGATLGISTPTSLPAVVAKAMMLQSSVDPSSVKLVNSGGSSDRYKAVVAGQVRVASPTCRSSSASSTRPSRWTRRSTTPTARRPSRASARSPPITTETPNELIERRLAPWNRSITGGAH